MAAGLELGMHGVNRGAVVEVGAGNLVLRAEQGHAVAADGRLQIGPVGRAASHGVV
jgi:hypothetical protein